MTPSYPRKHDAHKSGTFVKALLDRRRSVLGNLIEMVAKKSLSAAAASSNNHPRNSRPTFSLLDTELAQLVLRVDAVD
jgi:hypothetical protein